MVEDHSDSETGNKSPLHGLICTHPSSRWKEANVLFNDVLNTCCFWLYGVKHMVKDHSESERGNPLSPRWLNFTISSKDYFIIICYIPQTG